MKTTASYDFQNEYRGPASELERLRIQTLLSWEREARLLQWLGLQDGMRVLELGSGPGFVTEQLLKLLPASSLTAVDVDAQLLARAAEHLSGKVNGRLKLIQSSVTATGLPDNSYDFALARYLFQHLADPVAAAREIKRVLKPGGKLAIVDVDAMLWGIVEPFFPQLQAIQAKAARAQSESGGNRLVGRQLWRILREAGYQQVELESFVYHSDAQGLDLFLAQLDPDRLQRALKGGYISPAEFETAQALYQQFVTAPNAYVLMVGLIGCGKK
ncbi:MAG TPA: methyltransferase domain-containing protein [Anaerolineae bacterium]|nr:methyltransferase domain-containing protein [Anaerolineae bacterium]